MRREGSVLSEGGREPGEKMKKEKVSLFCSTIGQKRRGPSFLKKRERKEQWKRF